MKVGAFEVESYDNTISNNKIAENMADGISCMACRWSTVEGNHIVDNEANGIDFDEGNDDNEIIGNLIIDNNNINIRMEESSRNLIKGNTVKGSGSMQGIYLLECDHITIESNKVMGNEEQGIRLEISRDSKIISNTVADNDEEGIMLENGDWNVISDNTITHNRKGGIRLDSESEHNGVSDNTVQNNGRGIGRPDAGIAVQGDDNKISDNLAMNNEDYDLYDDGTTSTWQNNNYKTSSGLP